MVPFLLLVCLSSTPATRASEPTPLKPGIRQQRALAAGEKQSFALKLNAGDFVRAAVIPHGINIVVALVDPDGREVLKTDVTADTDAAEVALAVVDRPGEFRLTVASAGEKVPSGEYVVSLDPPRASTEADARRVAAMRALEASIPLGRQAERAPRRQAVDLLERSLAGFREAADPIGQSWALLQLAWMKYLLLSPDAMDVARQAVELCRGAGDRSRLSSALNTLGLLRAKNGEADQARADLLESLAVATGGPVSHITQETRARNALGILYGRTGDAERATEEFRRALGLARRYGHAELELSALNNLGIASKSLGEYEASLDYYRQSLALGRTTGDRGLQANSLNNMGNLYRILREYRKAQACHEQALALAREVGNRDHEGRALNTLGWTHLRLGEPRAALGFLEQALAIRRTVNDPAGLASTIDGIGMTWHALGDDAKAIDFVSEGLALRRRLGERYGEIESLAHLAQVKRESGRPEEGLADIEAAVHLADSLRGRLMNPDLRASFVAGEQERYDFYIDTLMQLAAERPRDGFVARALEASERGRARVLLESLIEARADIREGIDPALLDQERGFLRQLDDAGTKFARLSAARADSAAARDVQNRIARLTAEYQAIEGRIRSESPRYAALTQPTALNLAELQQRVLDDRTVLLEFWVGERRSWLWAVTRNSLGSFELPPRQNIKALARRLHALLASRQPKPREPADARAKRIRIADQQWLRESAAFSRLMLKPAARHLGERWAGRRLLIVAGDVLAYLPFGALPDPVRPRAPLIRDHEVVNVPSASVLAVMRHELDGRVPAAKTLALVADPVFDSDDPRVRGGLRRASVDASADDRSSRLARLPFSRREAVEIAALAPSGDVLRATDFDANRRLVASGELADYRIVHFATHGVLDSQHPRQSGLVLSLVDPSGRAQDGFLRLNDIYNLRLRADVVVLSACQTALGKEIRGEGIVGLTRGFMYAGARTVVASLWQVDDFATAELMKLFYRAMLKEGLAPAAALRAAQRKLAAQPQWASPFYWSAFVVQGDYR